MNCAQTKVDVEALLMRCRRRALTPSSVTELTGDLVQMLTEGEPRGRMNRPRRSYRQYRGRREGGQSILRANHVKN
jgi:hypothetical protein